ncbi:cell division protein FtsL [Candidatus Pelagibacter sp.]|nr:cell division protein FtsL [Candidatus Pelagibacter sp.]|tara:strand:- start:588 stop:896 length:309 start_codon:yes stop_codon:yes gene_type:complete
MKKVIFSTVIIILIFFTSVIKNSTKKIDVKIFNLNEDIRLLQEKYELVLLDHNYLTSPKKLDEYQKKFFENDLIPTDITEIGEINFNAKGTIINKTGEVFEK